MEYNLINNKDLNIFIQKYKLIHNHENGNKKKDVEKWALVRLLANIIKCPIINYPFEIVHHDKSDFEIRFNGYSIGIEFTEASTEQYKRALSILKKRHPQGILEPTLNNKNNSKKNDEIIKSLDSSQKRLIGLPSCGIQPEIDWAKCIHETIINKTEKFKNYNLFTYNWLLIYSNVPVVPIDIRIGMEQLFTLLKRNKVEFDVLFIIWNLNLIKIKDYNYDISDIII